MINDYNVFYKSIDKGLHNVEIASGKNYIKLLEAPPGANVRLKLHSNQGDDIPLKENYAIKATNVDKIYISANAIPGERILIAQAKNPDDFEIIDSPTINGIETLNEVNKINDFDNILIDKLDKIFSPYDLNNIQVLYGYDNNTTLATLINFVADCDKLIIDFNCGISQNTTTGIYKAGYIDIILDNSVVAFDGGSSNSSTVADFKSSHLELEGIRGKNIKIRNKSPYIEYMANFHIQKISLKA